MLTSSQIADVKGYLFLGHKQHDIAAHFGVNSGRIAEIAKGSIGSDVKPTPIERLSKIGSDEPMVRYFTSHQSLDEQKAILRGLIERPSDAARVYTISPELAQFILEEKNGANRKVSATKVSEYIDAMNDKRWPVTGATIVFSKSGFLMDGQHRLLACVRAGVAIKTYVVFGIDDGAFAMMDIGRKRTNVDAFAIAKIPYPQVTAKATRWLAIFDRNPEERGMSMTNDQALRWYEDNIQKQTMADCARRAIAIEKSAKLTNAAIPAGSTAALLYSFALKSKKDMVEFSNVFSEGKAHGRAVMSCLRGAMERSGGRVHEVYRNAIIILAWNAFRNGKRVTQATLNWSIDDGYPEVE